MGGFIIKLFSFFTPCSPEVMLKQEGTTRKCASIRIHYMEAACHITCLFCKQLKILKIFCFFVNAALEAIISNALVMSLKRV